MCTLKPVLVVAIIIVSLTASLNGLVNSPKIISKDGHLIFESGLDRNITFLLKGKSRLNVNDRYDIIDMLLQSNGGRRSPSLSSQSEWTEEEDAVLKELMSDVTSLTTRVFGPAGLEYNYRLLQNRTRNANQLLRRYKIRMIRAENRVQALYDILETDNCKSNPCQNGGNCLNIFGSYACKCPKNFEGLSCEKDVNECALYAGTDLGCQNGAQCVNQFGSYSCICQPGWFGIHCTQRKGDCMQSSIWELCGHGSCVGSNDTFGYKCICDQGWKTNGLTPACTVDVDECAESHTACVTKCINLPGSFTCAPCQAGLTGNGISCRDIDECAVQNGGCSQRPKVSCINSYGSYHCGECPLGWTGDGRTCERSATDDTMASGTAAGAITRCATSNICHPQAVCSEISNTVVCSCPEGMVGSGIGIHGCILGTAKNCINEPCLNGGTCVDSGEGFNCICPLGFLAPNCTPAPSLCSPNPCHNAGRCSVIQTASVYKYLCECRPGFRGDKCEKRANECGGILRGESGRLAYPQGVQSHYEHNSQCAWIIRTNNTLVLNVTFNNFELEDSTECRFDWLQINDGHSAASQIIGRFCGSHKPLGGNIISSTHQLYLWFRSDNSSSKEGFDLEWTSITPQCGGLVNVTTHGTISSPGSPGSYPKNRDCRWHLKAPNDKRLKLTFFSLQIETHDSCNYDYVEIIDAISDETLEKYCNSTHPQPVLLPTSEAIIHFHSDNIGTDSGFQIFYSTEERIQNCGGVYTAEEGIIQSPHIQDEAISCEYEIRVSTSQSIHLAFQKFEMAAEDCLEIFDIQPLTNENLLQAKYCGSEIEPSAIHSLFNKMILKFYGKPGAEFKIKYVTDCSYSFESPEGVIQTPNYPQLNNKIRHCIYKIITEPHTILSIHIDDFDLKDSSLEETDCAYTQLKIANDLDLTSGEVYCGEKAPPADIVSKNNMLIFHLKTGLTTTGRGFKLSYKAITMSSNGCGGVYTKPGYTIRLPIDEEGLYMHDMTCYWIIMAPKQKFIVIDWLSFELEESVDCSYDYVEIYDNFANSAGQALERYCDSHRPETFFTHSRILSVKFVSDSTDAAKGFEFTYKFVDAKSQCGGKIYSTNGELHTPDWPLNYTSDLDCIWTINAPPGTQLELSVEIFDIELSRNCSSDWLEIRNGGSNHSTLLGRFCGNMTRIPHIVPSFTNQMYLYFHSNSYVNQRGFQIRWRVFSNGCGGNLEGQEGVITSPLYPQPYPNAAECDWRIHVHPGSSIHLTIEDLALENYSNCRYDTLSIFEGTTDRKIHIDSICEMPDKNKPLEYIINNNQVLVQLRTDETNHERGFLLSYRANCTVTLTKNYGIIESPNYGVPFNQFSDDINCTWTIRAPKGNRVQAEFTYYDSVDKKSVLNIVDGNNKTYSIQGQGQVLNSTSDILTIKQTSNKLNFQLEYTMVGCINIFHAAEGHFDSPNYPKPYPVNVECLWEINTQQGRGIELTIDSLDIEDSLNCSKDALIISAHYQTNNVKERHCGQHEQFIVTTSSHKTYVRFISDGQANGKGFRIHYKTKSSSCGGTLQSKNGIITSPNYPNNYPENSDCEWTITVTPHHSIILTIEELDLEDFYDCAMDYVEAFEENSTTSDSESGQLQLFKQCGNMNVESNTTWRSIGNTVTVRFHADDSVSAKGFKLSFVEDCGEHITVDGIEFASIRLGKYKMENKTCEWQFVSKDPAKHVSITFRHVLLNPALASVYPNEDDCKDKGIVVYDGTSDTSPVRARFCKSHPADIYSNGNALTLQVPMNLIAEIYAFAYQVDNFCGNLYQSVTGKFSSPYYPSSYPVNIHCTWYIQASQGNSIALTFESMDLEDSDECNNDYVEVREADNTLGKLIGVYCGQTIPVVTKTANYLEIHFNSNNDIVGKGFLATYYSVKHNELSGTEGVVESPAYPSKFYSDEVYSWRITVDKNFVILLNIEHILDTDISYINFYDGYSDIGARIDYTDTHVVRSNTNILYFTATRGPFQFKWQQLSKQVLRDNQTLERMSELCGNQNLRINSSLYFSSPGFPHGYDANLQCSWTILPNDIAMHAEISFLKIDLEVFNECMGDYVRISKSSDLQNWQELGKMCKKPSDKVVNYQGNPYLKVEFTTDGSINKTGFSSLVSTQCGAEITDQRGFVNITELKSNLGSFSQDCVWTIKVRQGRRIRVTFPDFWLSNRNTGDNCKMYFLIRNGMAEDSPFLGKGKYCDNDITDVLETSSNRAFIKFSRTGYAAYRASFHYEEISQECSKEIVLTEEYKWDRMQTIFTPNYPNIPNPHSECIWKIIAPIHKTITLNFFGDYDLIPVNSDSKQCELEYVQVSDGGTGMAPIIGKYCGITKPNTIRSSSNIMRISYFTDVPEPHKGFQANVSISRCGGSYYDLNGTIDAPRLELKPDEKEMECVYILEMAVGSTINIGIDKINLPSPYKDEIIDCKLGTHLELQEIDAFSTDTENITDTLFLCGTETNRYIVETNKLRIVLRIKDGVYDKDAFRISYSAIGDRCGETIEGTQSILQSPNYPRGSAAPIHCTWHLKAPKGLRIKVEFLDFDMGSKESTGRIYRRITFANDPKMTSIIERVTDTLPSVVYSTDNTMTIDALILSFYKNRGFKLKYTANEYATQCRNFLWLYDDNFMAEPQTFIFKREDSNKSVYCSYDLKPSLNHTLSVQVLVEEKYNLTQQWYVFGCQFSSPLQLFAGDVRILPLLMCHNDTQPSFRMPFASKLVLSGHKRNGVRNIQLQIRSYKCGGIWPMTYFDKFVITQPEMKNHSGQLECAWAVWANLDPDNKSPVFADIMENMQVDVTLVTSFKGKCEEEYLIVYNGPNQNSPHLGRFCEQSTITNFVASGGVFVEFITQNYNPLSVFNLTIHEGSGCGGVLKYPYRRITFDYQYKNNVECVWEVITQPGFHLAAIFMYNFFIEASPNCTKDYLKIQQATNDGDWLDLVTLCGRSPPPMVNTTTTKMRIIFHSDDTIIGRGFDIDIERNCGGILYATDSIQQISSPNYPSEYPPNLVCNYTIVPSRAVSKTESESLFIRFIDFAVEDSPLNRCLFDNVTIYTINQNEKLSSITLCGRKKNYEMRSKINITIIFKSDGTYSRKGFLLEYGHNKCGGVITNSTIIESPKDSHTQMYPENSICTWQLQAPANSKIIIKFEYIDFQSFGLCNFVGVEVYKGINAVEDQRLIKLCGNLTDQKQIVNIPQNTGLLRSFNIAYTAIRGFKALINFIPHCDNHIHLTSSNSSYEFNHFSGQYANNLDCSWLFTTTADRQLKFEFNSFHVEDSSNCLDDYLEIHDGSGLYADEIGKFCGHELPSPFVSSGSTLLMRFVTDSEQSSSGFIANIKSIPKLCGQQNYDLTTQKMVTLTAPNDGNGKYPNNINCIWKISAENNIHLHFEKLDIEGPDGNGSCTNDYIKIINSDDADDIEKGYGSKLIYNGPRSLYSGSSNYAVEHIYCGTILPSDYFSLSKGLFIKFKSNNDVARGGFKLNAVKAEGCFRNFTGTQGRINVELSDDHCDFYIKAPVNYTISLYYNELSFSEYDCDRESVEIYDVRTNSSLQKLCEFLESGKSLFSNSNELRMRVRLSGYYTQIDMTYLASKDGPGCGGDFYNTEGIFTNPFYPEHVRNNSNCLWNIRVPYNLKVLLKFPVFNLGAKSTCRTDYLQIIEYDDNNDETIMRQFCGEDEPTYYESSKSFVAVRFHKSVNYDGTGWVIKFRGVHPGTENLYI